MYVREVARVVGMAVCIILIDVEHGGFNLLFKKKTCGVGKIFRLSL